MRAVASGTARFYDVAIIGGGINGCGIARDAVGRGWAVFLCEKGDLAGAKSLVARALSIYEKALGPEHPTATSVRNALAKLHESI